MAEMAKRTGMIGLGAMGLQMGRHMALKGFEVSGYDVSAAAAKTAEGHGIRICGSVTDVEFVWRRRSPSCFPSGWLVT